MNEKLTVKEAATLKKVHVVEVQQWIRAGRLPAEKVKAQWVIKKSDLDRFIKHRDRWVLAEPKDVEFLSVTMNATVAEFEKLLRDRGNGEMTARHHCRIVRRFVAHIGNEPLDRIPEERARSFFAGLKGNWKYHVVQVVNEFLRFAVAKLPVVVNPQPEPIRDEKELALREQWSTDKLAERKAANEDLIAKLARKLIDHYLYFQGRLTGGPDNLDDVCRFADECRELIQSNLPLFMKLSAEGRNIHSVIDERIQR